MTVIYIDLLFFLNLTADYLLLLAGARLAGAVLRRGRFLLGAAVGAAYAAALFLPGLGWLGEWPLRVCAGAVMCLAAYGYGPALPRCCAMFLGAGAALGGLVLAANLLGSSPLTLRRGIFYSQTDLRLLLLLFVLCYFLLSLIFRRLGRHGPRQLARVRLRLGGKTAALTALHDTGNTLTEPATNRPVLVAEYEALRPCLSALADPAQPVESLRRLHSAGERGYQLLPYRAVGLPFGMLLAVKAEGVWVDGKARGPLLIALSPTPVSDGGGYQGLIGGD